MGRWKSLGMVALVCAWVCAEGAIEGQQAASEAARVGLAGDTADFWRELEFEDSSARRPGRFSLENQKQFSALMEELKRTGFTCKKQSEVRACWKGAVLVVFHELPSNHFEIYCPATGEAVMEACSRVREEAFRAFGEMDWEEQVRKGMEKLRSKFPPVGERFFNGDTLVHERVGVVLVLGLDDLHAFEGMRGDAAFPMKIDAWTKSFGKSLPDVEYWRFRISARGRIVPEDEKTVALRKAARAGAGRAGTAGVSYPKCMRCPDPAYTAQARDARIEGRVLLQVVVMPDGRPMNVIVVRGLDPGLDRSSVETVQRWQFEPARNRAGEGVAVVIAVEVRFQIVR